MERYAIELLADISAKVQSGFSSSSRRACTASVCCTASRMPLVKVSAGYAPPARCAPISHRRMCGLQRYHYRDHCLYRYPCFPSELSDKSDFRRQFVTQFIPYPLLSERDKFANIARCSTAQIHHDVRVNV